MSDLFCVEANQLVQSFAGEMRSEEDKNYEQTIAQLKDEIQVSDYSLVIISCQGRFCLAFGWLFFLVLLFLSYTVS